VVHAPRFSTALALVAFFEQSGAERALVFGGRDTGIRVGGFAELGRRIDAGVRLFDAWLAAQDSRRELYDWACEHPHTGRRSDYGGREGPSLRQAWPVQRVLELDPTLHDPPASDPTWP
jgi:hypothetical protein